jgi:hypothetical protein
MLRVGEVSREKYNAEKQSNPEAAASAPINPL